MKAKSHKVLSKKYATPGVRTQAKYTRHEKEKKRDKIILQ